MKLKGFVLSCYKKCLRTKYNKRHKTEINSIFASLNASYGNNVRIDPGTVFSSDVTVGDESYVNKKSSLENCTIGKYCSVSEGVFISTWQHNYKAVVIR